MSELAEPDEVVDAEAELAVESLDALPVVVWEYLPRERRFTYVSAHAERLLGWTWPAVRLPGFWEAHLHPDDRVETVRACRLAAERQVPHEMEYRLLAEDGRAVWVHDVVRSVRLRSELRLRGVFTDVSREREEQARRHASEQQLRAILASFDGFIITFDLEGRVTAAYGRGLRYSRVPAEQFLGKRLSTVLGPGAVADERAVAKALSGETVEFERSSILHPDHVSARTYVIRVSPMRAPGGEIAGAVGSVHDVTAARALERSAMVTDRLASMGSLAAGVAHEVRNPLAFITANAGYLEQELRAHAELCGAKGASVADWLCALQEIRHGADRVAEIASELTGFSRIEQAPQVIDLREVVSRAARLVGPQVKGRGVLYVDAPHAALVYGDSGKLQQVVVNLIINALQAVPLDQEAEIGVQVRCDAEQARVIVEDNGPGVPPELLSKIFEPLFTTKPAGLGTGLGLSIVSTIVRAYRGTICVENVDGGGARFTVTLPAIASEDVTDG